MNDLLDEVLKFDPGRQEEDPQTRSEPSIDILDEVLKFDPGRRPEGLQPGEREGFGPLKGVPEKRVPVAQPAAGLFTLVKTGLVDDPETQIKIFAQARGIPESQYKIHEGDIIFKNKAGEWESEEGRLLSYYGMKKALVQTATNPAVVLGTAGALLGPAGAIAGAVGGQTIRMAIGGLALGEKQTVTGNLLNLALEGGLATTGELGGKFATGLVNRIKSLKMGKQVRAMKLAGKEVRAGALTAEEHAKAEMIRVIAKKHNIDLAPHQLYDREGMTNVWMYLRKHPNTSDSIRAFEDTLTHQTDEAIGKFIKQMGGYEETPFVIGKKLQRAAKKSIKSAEDVRTAVMSPRYQEAFRESPEVDIKPVIGWIDSELATAKGEVRNQLLRAKKILEKPDLPKVIKAEKPVLVDPAGKPIGGVAEVKNWDTSLQGLHGSKIEIDRIIETAKQDSLGNTNKRNFVQIKKLLLEQMEKASPKYRAARLDFRKLSSGTLVATGESQQAPVDAFRDTIIEEITKIKSQKGIATAPRKLLDLQNMPDAELLKEARKILGPIDPTTWKRMVGSYVRDVWEGLKVTQDGKIINAAGKMHQKLFGSKRQQKIMKAAMSKQEYAAFDDLMRVFQKAAIGFQGQSMTAPFQAIAKEMGEIGGSRLYRWLRWPREMAAETLFGKWNDILIAGRQGELLDALLSPKSVEMIKKIKPLTPGNKRFIEMFAVYTALISDKIGLEDIDNNLPEEQPRGQRQIPREPLRERQ